MPQYILKRLMGTLGVMLVIAILAFFFVHMLPGDPVRMIAGEDATFQEMEILRQKLGLNLPLHQQFYLYMVNLLQLDFGTSLISGDAVYDVLSHRYVLTAKLTLVSLWFIPAGIILGVVAATHKSRFLDRACMVFSVSGISVPEFWFGLILIQVFAVKLQWFNPTGFQSLADLTLPAITVGMMGTAVIARFTRSAFLDVLSENYIQTARAKGVKRFNVTYVHALRNAMLPIITVIGLQIGFILSGSIVVEAIFGLPGLGSLLIESVVARDHPVVQTLLLLYSFHFVMINFVVDVLYTVINPQVRLK